MAFALLGESERARDLFTLLNSVHHGGTPKQITTYKVEPYAVAGDGPRWMDLVHGSAGWMYRLLIETLLGVNIEGDRLRLAPHLPKSWTTCKIHCRYRQTVYHITITRLIADAAGANQVFLDGEELAVNTVPLVDDRREHSVELKVWSPVSAPENRNVLPNVV